MTFRNYRDKEAVFSQGDPADSVFYIESGTVKLTAVTTRKKAIIAILQRSSFFGEGCLAGQSLRICTVRSIGQSNIIRLQKERHGSHAQERPAVCDDVRWIFTFTGCSNRGRPDRSILQFQRKATGAGSVVVWGYNQGIEVGLPPEGEPINPGGDGWYHPPKGK